jgi:dipeptidyl aminopeptidase/acylaminoacyl peptidase
VAVDPDGRRLVWLSEKGQLQVMQLETQKVLARKDGIKSKTLAISPQGDAIAIARGKVVQLLRLPGLEVIKGLKGHTAEVTNLAWSPDGKYLASTDNRGVLLLRSNPDHKIIRKIQRPGPLYAVAFSPDSKYVAYGGHQRVLYQFKIGEKRDRVISRGQPYWITCIGYSPDGSTIVIGDESCDIWAYDVSTKKRLLHTKHHVECWLNTVAWTPDSKTFVFGCRPNRYAGKPATYTPLIYQEAVRSSTFQELNKQQRTLQQKLKELCQKDPSLADLYKRFEKLYTRIQGIKLSGKGEVLQYPNLAYDVEKSTVKGIVQAQLARSQVKSKELKKLKELLCQDAKLKGILDQIDKLEKQKGKAIQQRIQELNKNFCINQWSVKR